MFFVSPNNFYGITLKAGTALLRSKELPVASSIYSLGLQNPTIRQDIYKVTLIKNHPFNTHVNLYNFIFSIRCELVTVEIYIKKTDL